MADPEQAKCPIDHTKLHNSTSTPKDTTTSPKQCPIDHTNTTSKEHSTKTCPVDPNDSAYKAWLNLNPNNLMEIDLHKPTSQTQSLNLEREQSSIPNSEGKFWVYPSETQFYNAMQRKHKNPTAIDMKVVVPIHNAVNERAWNLILKYEEMYKSQCGTPKLVSFEGKPKQLSIKARMKGLLGYSEPFDRHDWLVDRCGTKVKYIIDFYSGKQQRDSNLPSFYLDVRPDLSLQGFKDRWNFFFKEYL